MLGNNNLDIIFHLGHVMWHLVSSCSDDGRRRPVVRRRHQKDELLPGLEHVPITCFAFTSSRSVNAKM